MKQDLELFLASQTSEGSVLESEGTFTLAVEKAKEKYLTFQEANPSYYFLRVFQAAVACRPERIRLTLGRSVITLWFAGSYPELSPNEVGKALEDPRSWDDSALGYLAVGLLCSHAAGATEAVWVQRAGEQLVGLAFSGESCRVAPASLSRDPEGCPGDFSLLTIKKPANWVLSANSKEHAESLKRCRHAPLPIQIDGRLLEHTPVPPKNEWCEGLTPPRFLCKVCLGAPEEPVVSYRCLEPGLAVTGEPQLPFFQLWLPEAPVSGDLYLPLALSGANRLVPVNSGVSLDDLVLEEAGVGASFFIQTELPVDLSGLAARDSHQLDSLKVELAKLIPQVATRLLPHLDKLEFELVSALKETGESAFRGFGAALTFGELGLLAAPLIAVGSVGVFAYNVRRRWKIGDVEEHLRQGVANRLTYRVGHLASIDTVDSDQARLPMGLSGPATDRE